MSIKLGDLVARLDSAYPPGTAESWDAVGLVCGDPRDAVRRVLLAVDPVEEVVEEAEHRGADTIVTHHPLLLRGVHSVSADTPKGRVVHRLIRSGIALYVAHTNADSAQGGVNDALADLIGLTDTHPLAPATDDELTLVTYAPEDAVQPVLDAISAAGAGVIGDYRRCAWTTPGTGTFEAGEAANPTIGAAGERSTIAEVKIEAVLPAAARASVVRALVQAHPYEEPPVQLLRQATRPARTGIGRVGTLTTPLTLGELASRLAAAVPATAHGVRVSGPSHATVSRVAVCSGAGDSLFDRVRASGADVYVTADLRHHPAGEARAHNADGRPYLIDLSHWASEWPWLPRCAALLEQEWPQLPTHVSTVCTDPWTFVVPSP
ncbi:MAG: Nif3-like dinuclear metal center hexameric protein [Actinomycetales bacterium]